MATPASCCNNGTSNTTSAAATTTTTTIAVESVLDSGLQPQLHGGWSVISVLSVLLLSLFSCLCQLPVSSCLQRMMQVWSPRPIMCTSLCGAVHTFR